jgi:purine nucleosidase
MTPTAAQAEVLNDRTDLRAFQSNTAVDFLRQTIRSRPGEITLLSIGPLTNLALLFAIDPEIPGMLKQLVMMCGVFVGAQRLEYNAIVDPHATAIVYNAAVQPNLSIGLDVTTQCRIEKDECRRRLRGGPLDVVAAMAEVWFSHGVGHITFHDPLAGAVVFVPEICCYEDGLAEVELLSRQVPGMLHWTPSAPPTPHRIAVGVDVQRFFGHYFKTVCG